ncbi:MAG TPA: MFS transporter, partial [Polyangiaceae bacterium]
MTAAARAPLTPYQRRLFGFLGVATFFEGYDFFALTQLLTNIRAEFGLDFAASGWLLGVINGGTVLAYLLVGKADRWGRRRVLSVTILGYTLFSLLSGLAPNVWLF